MNALAHPFVRSSAATVIRGWQFLSDLKVLLRRTPRHTDDEMRAIRGLASIHPAVPRKLARVRSMVVEKGQAVVPLPGDSDTLFSEAEIEECVRDLRNDGVHVFQRRLPAPLVSSLKTRLQALPARLRTEDGKDVLLRHGAEQNGLFDILEQDLMTDPVIQDFATHPTWLTIAQHYFGAPPVHDETVAWWTFPQSPEFASLYAQLFHSDRRRLSFLKFFTYLTDVSGRNGPHVVVPGSHRERTFALRADRRYEDHEVRAGCNRAPLEVVGEAGTVIAVDTQALHKGKILEEGKRLILEIQFATDLLGPPSKVLANRWSDSTKARIRANPRAFQRFKLG